MKIAVIPNMKATGVELALVPVVEALKALGAEVSSLDVDTDFLSPLTDVLIGECDVVVTLGGDGTIIHAAKRAALYGKPVLGINCGHLGFMAGLESDELTELRALICGDYTVEQRMMLDICVNLDDEERHFSALNEAVISRRELSRMIELEVHNQDELVMTYHADGVILATPTGSTAYSLSAGGPIIDPALNCMLMTPICPHSLHSRAYIFGQDAQLHVRLPEVGTVACLTIDGEEGIPINHTHTITVRRSDAVANMIKIKPMAFYEVLNKKLMNRR